MSAQSTTLPPKNGVPLESADTMDTNILSYDGDTDNMLLQTPHSEFSVSIHRLHHDKLPSLTKQPQLSHGVGRSRVSDTMPPNLDLQYSELPSIPKQPQLQHGLARSHLTPSMFDSNNPHHHTKFKFRDSNISVISRDDSVLNERYDSQLNALRNENDTLIKAVGDWEKKYEDSEKNLNEIEDKYRQIQIENQYMIESRMKLLNNTASEITKLKSCINAVLNICTNNNDNEMKQVITKMLKSTS